MNGFQCRITGDVGTQPIGKPGLARQCGADAASGHPANPSNCTIGPKNPLYWDQAEDNNVRLIVSSFSYISLIFLLDV